MFVPLVGQGLKTPNVIPQALSRMQAVVVPLNTHIVIKKTNIFFLFFAVFSAHQTLYGTVPRHNARSHAACNTTQFLANNNVLPWPSMSTDLNPNKHTWNKLERYVESSVNAPANVLELFEALK